MVNENSELNGKVDLLNKDILYKNHLIGEYLSIISKLEEHIKMKEDNYWQLENEN